MEKRRALVLLAFVCLVAAAGMHLLDEDAELRNAFYVPIPIGIALIFIAYRK